MSSLEYIYSSIRALCHFDKKYVTSVKQLYVVQRLLGKMYFSAVSRGTSKTALTMAERIMVAVMFARNRFTCRRHNDGFYTCLRFMISVATVKPVFI